MGLEKANIAVSKALRISPRLSAEWRREGSRLMSERLHKVVKLTDVLRGGKAS